MSKSIKNVDNLQASIESWITNIDSLKIYDLDHVLSPFSKLKIENIKVDNLLTLNPCENESNLIVERDLITGKILDYHENFIKTDENKNLENFDPELLNENELIFNIPTVFNGIDFIKQKELLSNRITKLSSKDEIVEINIADVVTNFNESNSEQIVKENEKKEDIIEAKIDLLTSGDAASDQKFWSQRGLLDVTNKLDQFKKPKTWAVEADAKLVKEYDKIKSNLAYQWKFELDVFQKQAVYLMENSESVFVAAHTSAGKTVVAEYAIALAFKHKTKVIYTSPIKALSNQKFREFKLLFEDVGLITGDIQISPEASCLIMTTEILRSMLYRRSETLRDLEWVIFDEVHYMNDAHRGVVWEETLILLPDHINIVMLSATIPNYIDFANWVGKIKQRNIYVMWTKKRPVPLEHFLYTGNSSKTSNELFLLVDSNSQMLNRGYTQAVDAKKNRSKASAGSFGPKGGKQSATPQQDKNIWLSIINMLQTRELLPAVAFIFSRKRCDDNINMLSSLDLNTQAEKSEVHHFVQKSLSTLNHEDHHIPQIVHLTESLKRGIGVHHSGILPLMKEIIELLFQRGLIKVLFATETFAMGINMPARTVIFDSIRKHDGTQFRSLQASEYIQMAGRAGRRGLDTTGTVIILCKGDVPEISDLQNMMLGKAAILESKFRLTYSMILSLLRQKDIKIQDFMKRSFFEHKLTSADEPAKYESAIEFLKNRKEFNLSNNINYLKCTYCSESVYNYYLTCIEYKQIKSDLFTNLEKTIFKRKILIPGRIVFIKGYKLEQDEVIIKLYPVLLIEELNSVDNDVLAISLDSILIDQQTSKLFAINEFIYSSDSKMSENYENLIEKLKKFDQVNVELPLLKQCLAIFKDFKCSNVIKIAYTNIEAISNRVIKLNAGDNISSIIAAYRDVVSYNASLDDFEEDLKRKKILNENLIQNNLFVKLALNLYNYTETYMTELLTNDNNNSSQIDDLIDYIKDLNIRDIDFTSFHDDYKDIQSRLSKFKCIQCSNFSEHFQQVKVSFAIQDRIDYINDIISGNTLLLLSEYRYRIEALKKLRLIDEKSFVLLKGRVALELSVMELFLTELIIENLFSSMSANEIVALLSSVVYQQKTNQDELKQSFNNALLDEGRDRMLKIASRLNRIQNECGVPVSNEDDFVEQLHFGLVEVVYEWSKGISFTAIKQLTDEQEGIIVRTIQRLDEVCNNLSNAAKIIGDTILASKMEHCSTLIRRDIVFAGSLYTKTEIK